MATLAKAEVDADIVRKKKEEEKQKQAQEFRDQTIKELPILVQSHHLTINSEEKSVNFFVSEMTIDQAKQLQTLLKSWDGETK